jgi:chemotaxis protein CheD
VTLFDRREGFGGICHALLPTGKPEEAERHVDGAITLLLDRMLRLGASRTLLEAKLFGGSRVLGVPASQQLTVGEQNLARARELLKNLKLRLLADDTGGLRGRMLFFNSGSGEVFIRKVRNSTLDDRNQEVALHG